MLSPNDCDIIGSNLQVNYFMNPARTSDYFFIEINNLFIQIKDYSYKFFFFFYLLSLILTLRYENPLILISIIMRDGRLGFMETIPTKYYYYSSDVYNFYLCNLASITAIQYYFQQLRKLFSCFGTLRQLPLVLALTFCAQRFKSGNFH